MTDEKAMEPVAAEVLEPIDEEAQAIARIKTLEEDLLVESANVCQLAMQFGDLPFDAEEPPKEWVESMGVDEAWRKFRYVKSGQMPGKYAPSGLKVATAVFSGLMKARSDSIRPPQMGVMVVNFTAEGTPISYPEVKVED